MRIYLENNPPARSQYRLGRRADLRPVIVAHTAESGPTSTARGVARFIQGRSDPGSYHLIGDTRDIIQLVDFGNEAFGDATGSNKWAIHISLAMDASEWKASNNAPRKANLLDTFAQMAATVAHHLEAQKAIKSALDILWPKWPVDRDAPIGVTSHALRDPTRRTDPGAHFPWNQAQELTAHYVRNRHLITKAGQTMPTIEPSIHVQALQEWLYDNGRAPAHQTDRRRYADGIFGPITLSDTLAALNTGPGQAGAYKLYVEAVQGLAQAQAAASQHQETLDRLEAQALEGVEQG